MVAFCQSVLLKRDDDDDDDDDDNDDDDQLVRCFVAAWITGHVLPVGDATDAVV